MGPDASGQADRSPQVHEGPSLLDMDFNESSQLGQALWGRPELGRVGPGPLHGLRQGDAVCIRQGPRRIGAQGPAGEPTAYAGHPETGAFLVGETDDGHRAPRGARLGLELIDSHET